MIAVTTSILSIKIALKFILQFISGGIRQFWETLSTNEQKINLSKLGRDSDRNPLVELQAIRKAYLNEWEYDLRILSELNILKQEMSALTAVMKEK